MKPYETDILCMPWYWGGPDANRAQPNHVTRTVKIHDGKWKNVGGLRADADPASPPIEAMEKKEGIKINDQVPLK